MPCLFPEKFKSGKVTSIDTEGSEAELPLSWVFFITIKYTEQFLYTKLVFVPLEQNKFKIILKKNHTGKEKVSKVFFFFHY